VAEKYGERAVELRDAHVRLEPRAWALIDDILTPEQKTQLQQVIDDWRARNPKVRVVACIHFHDFAKAIGKPGPGESRQPGSLFSFLGLDPLSNLDPAVREITQTRHLAERAIFYMQRAPNLIDMQIERLTYQFTSLPETKALLVDLERTSVAAEAAGKLATQLPEVVARERQAAIAQFTDALYAQESQMRELAVALRGTLEAGTATSDSLNATIRSLDALMKRFQKPEGAEAEPAAPKKPFDIADYAAAAREFSETARELQVLIQTIDAGTPGLASLTQRATGDLKGVIDHLFWRLVVLVVIVIVLTVVALLAYRLITHRLLPRHSHPAGSVVVDERKRA
jgi:Spy/CpxP family protein refolding chaperone